MNVKEIRQQFPILNQNVHNDKALVYLDNAATNQKPQVVIDAIQEYYTATNANIHRGIHFLAEKATKEYEDTRKTLQQFLNTNEAEEIIFTKGVTESINLVASTYGRKFIKEGDEIIISGMEHHSNIVPWQILCEEVGAILKVIPLNEKGELIMEEYHKLLNEKTKFVSVVYVSNALGTINPIKEIIDSAHEVEAKVLIDGAQASSHISIDVQALDVDFYTLSAHKLYGPTGVGALYGKRELLEAMPPYQGGGEMIKEVSFEKTTYNEIPYKFEAGTPNIGDIVAFKKAIDFVNEVGIENIAQHEDDLLEYATEKFSKIEGLKIIGQAEQKVSVISFVFDNIHHYDLGMMLDARGIAVRTGHHCTQPLMKFFGIEGTTRASFAVYNTKEEIDLLVEGIKRVIQIYG
ncbi:MAG: cysteine desulfurase [Cytophagales bacterium]|nr:cysteine desulfurase [Cytophagales bacterium]